MNIELIELYVFGTVATSLRRTSFSVFIQELYDDFKAVVCGAPLWGVVLIFPPCL